MLWCSFGLGFFNLHFSSAAKCYASHPICCYEESCSSVKAFLLLVPPSASVEEVSYNCLCITWLPAVYHGLLPSTLLWTLEFFLLPSSVTDPIRRLQVSHWLFFPWKSSIRGQRMILSTSVPSLWWVKVLLISLSKHARSCQHPRCYLLRISLSSPALSSKYKIWVINY